MWCWFSCRCIWGQCQRLNSIQRRLNMGVLPLIQKTHRGYLCSWAIHSKVTPLTFPESGMWAQVPIHRETLAGRARPFQIVLLTQTPKGEFLNGGKKRETLAVPKVYIYLLLFAMTNFTPKMTHTGNVFDLIAFIIIIIIINDNNSTAAVPQGPSWDQGSVLIGTEHTEKTNLALRILHLIWRRHTECREKEVVLSLFCLRTERLSGLPEVRQVFGGRGSTELCWKLPGAGDQAGHTSPFKNSLAHFQQGGLQAGSRAGQDSKGRALRGEWPALAGVGVSTWPHPCLHGRSMKLHAAQQTKLPLCPWGWATACCQPREMSLQQTPHFCLPQNQFVGYLGVSSKAWTPGWNWE